MQEDCAVRGICTDGEFRRVLERERARADRRGDSGGFSLLIFNVGDTDCSNCVPSRRLALELMRRVRITDEVGWFSQESIGVLLPDTTPTGAWELADHICQVVDTSTPSTTCTVYSYPSNWWEREKETARYRRAADRI
jgi:hypothetical protein